MLLEMYFILFRSRGTTVGIATGYRLDGMGWSSSPDRVKKCHVSILSRRVPELTQPLSK
jgi:hypothetical protein